MHLINQVEATKENFLKFIAEYPKGEPVVMVNILKFKEKTGKGDETGQQAYSRYSKNVAPLLAKVGGQLIWAGKANFTLIGDLEVQPDSFLIVQYPSIEAFVSMSTSPEYRAIAHDRVDALEYGGLVATKTFAGL